MIRFIATATLILVFIGVLTNEADAANIKNSDCTYQGVTNLYAEVGEEVEFVFDLTGPFMKFHEFGCRIEGQKIYVSKADTAKEVRYLQKEVRKSSGLHYPVLYCSTGKDEGYMIGLLWVFETVKLSDWEKRHYRGFADRWARSHNCR